MTLSRNLGALADNVNSSGQVTITAIAATGTPSSTTYLRGDSTWATASSAAATAVSTTPPSSPVNGQKWVNTLDGVEYTYFVDGDSSQWIELGPTQGSGISGAGGTMFLNTNTISTNYTLAANSNAQSVGPITQLSGTTVVVPATQRWLIV